MSKVHEDAAVNAPPLNGVDSEAEERRLQIERNQAAIRLLRSWREEGDEQEQKETWEFIRRALDEDRLSDRKLFPCDE
jgi:hypothetical protein